MTTYHVQTIAQAYQEICQGEQPWVALGNFLNEWFDYSKHRRVELIVDALSLPEKPTLDELRWAAYCAATVEWLCQCYEVACPAWALDSIYMLSAPWFDSPGAYKPLVRERLIEQTPEPFSRRNIYCGNRMFANKYELADLYSQSRKAIAERRAS